MPSPINPNKAIDTKASNFDLVKTISNYAGRIWKWILEAAHQITHLFFSKTPTLQVKSQGDLKGKVTPIKTSPTNTATPKLQAPPTPESLEPEIIGANDPHHPRGAAKNRQASPKNEQPQPEVVLPPPPIAVVEESNGMIPLSQKLQNTITHPEFTQIRVMNQRLQRNEGPGLSIGDEACSYQSFKNALVAIALANGAAIPANTFENEDVYYYFYDFMKVYRIKEEAGFRDMPVSTMPTILHDFIQLSDENIASIENDELRTKITAIHKATQSHHNSVGMFNVKEKDKLLIIDPTAVKLLKDELLITDPTALRSLSVLREAAQNPGPCTYAFLMGDNGHWTTVILEKNEEGHIRWYGCDSWPGSPVSVLNKNIGILENTILSIDKTVEEGYMEAVGADFRRLTQYLDANGQPKQDLISQHHIGSMLVGHEDYFDKLHLAFRFVKDAGWLENSNPTVKGYLKDLKLIANYLNQISHVRMKKTVKALNTLALD